MFLGLAATAGILFVGAIGYGIGTIHGYDKWDREHESFQNGVK